MKKSAVNKENHRIDYIDINKKEILELIAKRIQQERKRKGFTQQDLADFIDSSAVTIQVYRKNDRCICAKHRI